MYRFHREPASPGSRAHKKIDYPVGDNGVTRHTGMIYNTKKSAGQICAIKVYCKLELFFLLCFLDKITCLVTDIPACC